MTDRARLGILGGGQLARMLSVAASRVGVATHVYSDQAAAPARHVASRFTHGDYLDPAALDRFAESVDVVTYEFENLPVEAVRQLERQRPVRPGSVPLSVCQDRLVEKRWLNDRGLPTVTWAAVDGQEDLAPAVATVGLPAVLKTRRMGYDGKGQVRIESPEEADAAWAAIGGQAAVLEKYVDLAYELSVIVARDGGGEVVSFDPGMNEHSEGILRVTRVPADAPAAIVDAARQAAETIVGAFDYVGVMGIEYFVTAGGELLVNEMAPRVHNSGHWSQNGCVVDQFEQHVRAVMGLPLGSGRRYADVVMTNLIGSDVLSLDKWLREPNAAVHLYGKAEVRAGRKMGHVNVVAPLAGNRQ